MIPRHLALVAAGILASGVVASHGGASVCATHRGVSRGPQPLSIGPDSAVLFASDDPLTFTIEMDWRTVVRDRDTVDQKDHPAVLILAGADGDNVRLDIGVRPRGHFRRQRRICDFPPLRIDIKRRDVGGTVFRNQDKLKLVTHCRNARDDYEQYVLKEYLIYRSFNLLTDYSFRVRLARITYVDTQGREETREKYGFLIESDDELAKRIGGFLIAYGGSHPADVKSDVMGRIDVFQFMIGNTDWSVVTNHNMKLFETDTDYIVVPYDFDWAGAVSARYARPDERFGTRSVRDRVFRGFCGYREDVLAAIEQLKRARGSIFRLYHDLTPLTERERQRTLEYYDDFYEILDNPRAVERELLRPCRGA